MTIRSTLTSIFIVSFILLLGMFTVGGAYLQQQGNLAALVNISGRQRMQCFSIVSDCQHLLRVKKGSAMERRLLARIQSTTARVDNIFTVFRHSGSVSMGFMGVLETKTIPAASGELESHLGLVMRQWGAFQGLLERFLQSRTESELEKLIELTNNMLPDLDLVVLLYQRRLEQNAQTLLVSGACLVLGVGVVFLLVHLLAERVIFGRVATLADHVRNIASGNVEDPNPNIRNGVLGKLNRAITSVVVRLVQETSLRIKYEGSIKRMNQVVDQQHKRFWTTFDLAAVGMAHVSSSGVFLRVNRSLEETLGLDQEELCSMSMDDLEFQGQRASFMQGVRELSMGMIRVLTQERQYVRPDRKNRWLRMTMSSVLGEDDSLLYYIVVIDDITELIVSRQALEKTELDYRTIFENTPDGISITEVSLEDGSKRLVDCNNSFWALSGHHPDDLKSIPNILDKQSHPRPEYSVKELRDRMLAGLPMRGIFSWLRPDGKENYMEYCAVPVPFERSIVVYQIDRDVTDRIMHQRSIAEYSQTLEQRVEEKTKELKMALVDANQTRDRLNGILQSIGDGLLVLDEDLCIVLVNPAAEDILSINAARVTGNSIERVTAALEGRLTGVQFGNMMESVLEGGQGKASRFEVEMPDCEGIRFIRGMVFPVSDGNESGMIITLSDMTPEYEVNRMKTEFISTAAHELRTPMTSIQGFSELLLSQSQDFSEETQEFISIIHTNAISMASIITDLLDISRIESGRGIPLVCKRQDIRAVVASKVREFGRNPAYKSIELEADEDEAPLYGYVDKLKLGQVLENLFSNASKYAGDDARIVARVNPAGGQVLVEVCDDGVGMTEEQLDNIFEKFYRGPAADSGVPGTGLGMSIVKYIVEAHNGSISVESSIGSGTTVRILLPAITANDAVKQEKS